MSNDDDLVAFRYVRVVRSTAPALFCAIGDERVWLPRRHIRGNLWRRGDCGDLLIRRWVAVDRRLIDPDAAAPWVRSIRWHHAGRLQLLPAVEGATLGVRVE